MRRRLTLVAGSGELVPHVAAAARRAGDTLQVIDLGGRGDIAGDEVLSIPLGRATELIAALKAFRPTHILLAGGIHISDGEREGLARAFGGAGWVAGGLGDIGLAGLILMFCRLHRIRLVGAHDVAPDLLTPEGHIAGPPPDAAVTALAPVALRLARAIGAIDLGQAIVMSGNRPLAAEDAGGTDALLARVAALRTAGLTGDGTRPLVLAKARKPKQPAFVDLPAIGPDTVVNAEAAGVSAIVLEARATLLLDRAQLEIEAAARGVTIVGRRHG